MSTPIEGSQYTIQPGDTLSKIAARAYGDATLWPRIWNANQTTLFSDDPEIVTPGEVIIIPILPERKLPPVPERNREPNSMSIILDGMELKPVSGVIIRTIDTIANAYKCTIPWTPGADPELDSRISPYSYKPAAALIGNDVIVTGANYTVETNVSAGVTARLEGATPTVDLVDSTLKPPLEFNNITLEDIITGIVEPLGFRAVFEVETAGKFDRVKADQGDTVFEFLSKLVKQRDALLSCDTDGNLVVTRANVESPPVATFEENVTPGVSGWGGSFDGRGRFSVYRAVGRNPSGNIESTVVDPKVPRTRFTTIRADESTKGELEAAARWARNKTLADALTFGLKIEGWRSPDGNLWRENTIVTVISTSMFIPNGFDFLIKRVEYILDSEGQSANLSLVPPTVYSKDEIIEPW